MSISTPHITALAWLMGMMVSPEALALQGNLSGLSGVFFFLPLAAALLLHGWHTAAPPWPDDGSEAAGPPPGLVGAFSTSLLLLCARPAVAVCLATAALVTAGFVFNEVFFYWFPNFGFAALLLVALLILNLAGRWIAAAAQILFTFTALFGLAGLALIGLSNGEPGRLALPFEAGHHGLQACGLAAIAFVGYDLLQYTTDGLARPRARSAVYTGLGIGGLILCAWNAAALIHVEASRLAGTSIPYILTARSILGQTGRIVMGIVVIAGACAAVNLLFRAVARMMAAMAEQGLMPAWVGKTPSRPWLPLTVMAGMSGGLMALGFAGTDLLDLSLRAGLILWLISMGLHHLAPLVRRRGFEGGPPPRRLRHVAIMVTMLILAGVLVGTDDTPFTLAHTMLTLVAIAAGLAAAGLAAARGSLRQTRNASQLTKGVLS